MADVHKLVDILERLTENKNTVVVIEHNLDVIKTADYIIDMGPESGDDGGRSLPPVLPKKYVRLHGLTPHISLRVLQKARDNNQYKDISAFIDTERLEEEQLDILTGPRVRRRITEDGDD